MRTMALSCALTRHEIVSGALPRACATARPCLARIALPRVSSPPCVPLGRLLHHQRGGVVAAADGDAAAIEFEPPETARDAIDQGLVLCKQQRWADALAVFEKGLNLPGTGIKRFRDKPPLISDGEKMAVLYNIACCQAQLGDARSGLVALSSCLELGYTDFRQIRSDPDLDLLRQDPRFEGLMERFQKKGGFLGIDLGSIFGGR